MKLSTQTQQQMHTRNAQNYQEHTNNKKV